MRFFISFIISLTLFSKVSLAQSITVSISGQVISKTDKSLLPFANIILKTEKDSIFVTGTLTNEQGRFIISGVKSGSYIAQYSCLGHKNYQTAIIVGQLSEFLDLGTIELEEDQTTLDEVSVTSTQEAISSKMDKKTYKLEDNVSQAGGSVLQSMQNLPGVTVQDGKIQIRGSDKIVVLIDGKQTALSGFGNQSGLDNIPASAVERIEIINNPSSKYDANGNAGIINIILKKSEKGGFNGKVALSVGMGALWIKKDNLPTIRPQFQNTPKINPSLSLNYKKKRMNVFFQGNYLYTQTLNKNEFVTRTYDDGEMIRQQTKRNRLTTVGTAKSGFDFNFNDYNSLNFSGLFSTEHILDNGDEPFFNKDLSERKRLWQFLEDELKTTVTASGNFEHKFAQAGHKVNISINYTFHREDEKYFFTNIMPTFTGKDAFKLISDEHVADFTADYVKPLKYGRFETGLKFRKRVIPTNMQFFPGQNSPLDSLAGGKATYDETIPAVYGNYIFENKKVEIESGLRLEYVELHYKVDPKHNTYKSNGYSYAQPFPNLRMAYKFNNNNKLSIFYSRRVDRPNEVDIRIFPKYDDAEIIKIGNPALKPQFTNLLELAFKSSYNKGYVYASLYHRITNGTISRIGSTDSSKLIYSIMQNVGYSFNTGIELIYSQNIGKWLIFNLSTNAYKSTINAFSVTNLYPDTNTNYSSKQEIYSGNIKLNSTFKLPKNYTIQFTAVYLAPNLIPQGKIDARFSLDLGAKKSIQKGKGEIFINAIDLLNTLIIRKKISGTGFNYISTDYYETQVVRFGYNYKF